MRTILLLSNLILILSLFQNKGNPAYTGTGSRIAAAQVRRAEGSALISSMTVSLRTATDATILFKSESGKDGSAPREKEPHIPYLILNRNGVPTPSFERTLHLSLGNLLVPPSGLYVGLEIETRHEDPDPGRGKGKKIRVWEEKRFIPYWKDAEEPRSIDFKIMFQHALEYQKRPVRTPTDYYDYKITVWDAQGNILQIAKQTYAFLMENQWQVPLPEVLEASPGAAPRKMIVYFCDMIPFQSDPRNPETLIPRQDVEQFIQTELIPAMVNAFVVQSNVWDMPWYEEWSNSRTDEDPKTLSVALGERGTWFHGAAPSLGHAMVSIRVDGSFGSYSSMIDGIMSVFHHELFHNQQRNISLHFGSKGNLLGKEQAWEFFSEGTAVLASSVGQPAVQFEPVAHLRSYPNRANTFIGSEGAFGGGLNKSYEEVPYQTSIYWRFLYEACGGIKDGVENPAVGMKVIRNVLETLYKGEIVNINSSTNAVGALPQIIDSALQANVSCPFKTHKESLVHFARAIYLLGLEDGRCAALENPSSCGFYDPHHIYTSPHMDKHAVAAGSTLLINGSIPSSYGIDLTELTLDPSVHGKSVKIILRATSTPQDEFHVELRRVHADQSDPVIKRSFPQFRYYESMQTKNGLLILEVPVLDAEAFNGLGIIITRLDPHEDWGSPGNYVLQVAAE